MLRQDASRSVENVKNVKSHKLYIKNKVLHTICLIVLETKHYIKGSSFEVSNNLQRFIQGQVDCI